MDHVTGLFSGANLITSVEVPEGMIATFDILNEQAVKDAVAKINQGIIADARCDSWPSVVDEAYQGDPNKKLIRMGCDFYVLDLAAFDL